MRHPVLCPAAAVVAARSGCATLPTVTGDNAGILGHKDIAAFFSASLNSRSRKMPKVTSVMTKQRTTDSMHFLHWVQSIKIMALSTTIAYLLPRQSSVPCLSIYLVVVMSCNW